VIASLPAAPSLEQLRKQAKDLLRAHRAADGDAVERVAARHPRPDDPLKLSGAQLVVARENGFPSWSGLRAYVERVQANGPGLQHAYHDDLHYYEGRGGGLLASAQDGTAGAVAAFERWDAPLSPAGARAVVARQHGFRTWAALRRHASELGDSGEPFARAYRALEAHDVDALAELLDRFPFLVGVSGTNGNDLLGMATATCDERLVALLLERGADPARANAHGWTPLHQAAYRGLPLLQRMLLEAGAPVDVSARGDGGTPLVVALFWGHREAAELLAGQRLVPLNLRVAAGLGRLGLLEELVAPNGRLAPRAGSHREFYRPHSGFPHRRPSDDPQEVLDEGLLWAVVNERVDAARTLIVRGAQVNGQSYPSSPLFAAAGRGSTVMIGLLLEHGADPDRRETMHNIGATALHEAACHGHLAALEMLLGAGADPTVRDALSAVIEHEREHALRGHAVLLAAARGASSRLLQPRSCPARVTGSRPRTRRARRPRSRAAAGRPNRGPECVRAVIAQIAEGATGRGQATTQRRLDRLATSATLRRGLVDGAVRLVTLGVGAAVLTAIWPVDAHQHRMARREPRAAHRKPARPHETSAAYTAGRSPRRTSHD
jgi:ankyrin repeat protein